jgi:flagellar biosynthesis protein FlhG
MRRLVIGISGGMDVGKSTIALNLGVYLASQGHAALLIDLSTNLHRAHTNSHSSMVPDLTNVLSHQNTLDELIMTGPLGLGLLQVSTCSSQYHGRSNGNVDNFLRAIRQQANYDIIILDLAAGISGHAPSLLQACDLHLVIVRNDYSSIVDAYSVIKVLGHELDLAKWLWVLPNRVASPREGKIAHCLLNDTSRKFLSMQLNYLSSTREDRGVKLVEKASVPMICSSPDSRFSRDIRLLSNRILNIPRPSISVGG